MKQIIATLALLTTMWANAQAGQIEFQFTQDVSLALTKDGHGNTPFTTDVRFDFRMNGNEINGWWLSLGWNFEYANLYGGTFYRYGINGAMSSEWELISIGKIKQKKFQIACLVGVGIIHRVAIDRGYISLEMGIEQSFRLNSWLYLMHRMTLMQRGDLIIYDDPASSFRPWDWQPQWHIGFKIALAH